MNIRDVVSKEFNYVCPRHRLIHTPWGDVEMLRGTLFDGATGVIDLDPESFGPHDVLYRRPIVKRRGKNVRVGKFTCDLIYGYRLWKDKRFGPALWRPFGLTFVGWPSWLAHRRKEKELGDDYEAYLAQTYVVPKEACWDFPSYELDEAVWLGGVSRAPESAPPAD